jgi:hypothetical protein
VCGASFECGFPKVSPCKVALVVGEKGLPKRFERLGSLEVSGSKFESLLGKVLRFLDDLSPAGVDGRSAAITQMHEMTVVGSVDDIVRFAGRRTQTARSRGTGSSRVATAAATKHIQKRPAPASARLTTAGGRFARLVEGLANASAS